jgi:hypothetical protein
MNTQNTVTARHETREVEPFKQKQDMIVLEMPLEVAMTLLSLTGVVYGDATSTYRGHTSTIGVALVRAGVRRAARHCGNTTAINVK